MLFRMSEEKNQVRQWVAWSRGSFLVSVHVKLLYGRKFFNHQTDRASFVFNVYNKSGRVVLSIQSRTEAEWLYIQNNTDANVVNNL